MVEIESGPDDLLTAGRLALAGGDWPAAAEAFTKSAAGQPTAEAFEGLAEANWWQHQEAPTFEARERAYHLYRRRGDVVAAARMAMLLAQDSLEFRGEAAVCNGWMRRARRLLRGHEQTPAYGLLLAFEGNLALMMQNDTALATTKAHEAADCARTADDLDLEMFAIGLEGLARVSAGEVEEGMALLDEAAAIAVSDETQNIVAKGSTLCFVMDACDRVRDYDRAAQWCARADALAVEWRADFLPAVCRPHLAVVLIWRGRWAEAERELTESTEQMRAIRPLLVGEAVVRLAELRVRQGRLDEARALLTKVEGDGLAHVGLGELALASDDPVAAMEWAERRLRHLPLSNRVERAPALELLVRARVFLGDLDGAEPVLAELKGIAEGVGTTPLIGSAHYVSGLVALARGDAAAARQLLEDAIDYFRRDGAPFEAARARLDLARALRTLGKANAADQELDAAALVLRQLGASAEAQRAEDLRAARSEESALPRPRPDGLTDREVEVLRMVAASASNQEIAARLYLSTRTVERHISSIYAKLGLAGRGARSAATTWAFTHGLGGAVTR